MTMVKIYVVDPVNNRIQVFNPCIAVGAGLWIDIPCAEYDGNRYGFILASYHHPNDPSGFYWKLLMPTLTNGAGSHCLPVGADLSIPMECVSYNGTADGFTLKFYDNPHDPHGYYWVTDKSTLVVK